MSDTKIPFYLAGTMKYVCLHNICVYTLLWGTATPLSVCHKVIILIFFFFDNFGHKKIYTNAQTRTWIVNFAICILNGVTHCVVSSRFIWYIVIDICEILLEFDVYVCIQK